MIKNTPLNNANHKKQSEKKAQSNQKQAKPTRRITDSSNNPHDAVLNDHAENQHSRHAPNFKIQNTADIHELITS
jgi:hypothetical protein